MKKIVQVACIGILMAFLFGVFAQKIHHDGIVGWHSLSCASAEECETQDNGLNLHAKAAFTMEYHSETPIYQKDATKRLPIASMCKIMTLLLSFEAIDDGDLSMEEEILVSENAASMGGSQVFLEANARYSVRELLKSIVVCSANDSCVAMAERICGSDDLFVAKMNERAVQLGCENTLFSNCTGLPKEPQYSCALDVAKMLKALLSHEEYYQFGKIWMDRFQHPEGRYTEISNTNRLVKFYDGCDGGKTGFTSQAGFCLAATAKRNGMRIISVVIGEEDSKQRFADVAKTFDYAFANYCVDSIVEAGVALQEQVVVTGGKEGFLMIAPQRDGIIFSKRGKKENVSVKTELNSQIKAPIEEGAIVGTITIYHNGVETDTIPLIALKSIEKAGIFDCLQDVARAWNFQ